MRSYHRIKWETCLPGRLVLLSLLIVFPVTIVQLKAQQCPAFVSAAGQIRIPQVETRQEGLDLTLNEITFLHHQYPFLAGNRMNVCIKENLFDTADIDFKGRIQSLELAAEHIDVHATNMASIAAGGGNDAPASKGVAWDANLSSSDFSNLLPDPDEHFIQHDISVQNHAYGTGIENYYGIESAAYDAMTNRIPTLVHVFSSGNKGDQPSNDGPYAGLTGWANLTGQFKQSKNTITVGATDSLDQVVSLSSRGPAYDGRIKPELVAYGHGGSSGAAAIVSGVSILIQESFKKIFGELPPSTLVKATLINSARDIGTQGPDHKSGYGSLQAYQSVQTIEEGRFINDIVREDEEMTIPFSIPSGVKQAKFTLTWLDQAADPFSSKSLINDLDLRAEETPSSSTWYPWTLNTQAAEDSLMLPATRGIDTLNNIEQIIIDDPAPGEYLITIKATDIETPTQAFSLVWQFEDKLSFQWTFPTRDDHLKPGKKNVIRWNSSMIENGSLEFRMIHDDWRLIENVVSPDSTYYIWQTPDEQGLAQLRWSTENEVFLSDTFVIANPLNPQVILLCADSLLFSWERPAGSDGFEIVSLGQKHLRHLDFTEDSFYVVHQPDIHNPYFAVAALYGDIKGPYSQTFDYTRQGAGCFLNIFYLRHVLDGKAFFTAELGTFEGIDFVVLEEKRNDSFTQIQMYNQIDTTVLFFESGSLKQGVNEFRLKIVLDNGKEILSQVERVYFVPDQNVLLFPNPASADQEINIITRNLDDFELRIFDMQGKEIYIEENLASPASFMVKRLHPGIYIIQIISEEGIHYSELLHIYI